MQDLPRGNVTFLFTDIQDYTHLSDTYPEEMRCAKAIHDAILNETSAAHGGSIYERSGGDARKIAFVSALGALQTAIAAQIALTVRQWPMKEPLRVRMALHMCEAYPETDGNSWFYQTPRLNRMGRLLTAGHGGQILLSSVVEEHVREELPAGVTLRNLGEHRFRGRKWSERIFQVVHDDLPNEFEPIRSADRYTDNLPFLPTPLIGREREAEEVRALLLDDRFRLVTLTGTGGSGKTRLAIHVAKSLIEAFTDGVFLIDFASLQDSDLVPSMIARTIGAREDPEKSPTDSLKEWLKERQILLVLDTFEQVSEPSSSFLTKLLEACPHLKLLVASRRALRIRAEHESPVLPLAIPKPDGPTAHIVAAESVRLFVERAQSLQSTFKVTDENARTLAEICARLDGLPLAIELAAARIKVFPPAALHKALRQRLPLLTGGPRDLPQRQQTLRGAIAWSYDQLSEEEKALIRRLAVFNGGFTFETASVLLAGEGSPSTDLPPSIFDGIQNLIDNSLLRSEEQEGEPRFLMLDTIREFGEDRLEATGESVAMHDLHATVFLDLAEQTEPHLRGAEREDRLESLDRERDNLRAALGWLHERGDAERGLRLASALWQWWWWRTSLAEGRRWLDDMLKLPGADAYRRQCARALTGLATLVETQGEHEESEELFVQAESLWQEEGDKHGLATSFLFRWLVAFDHENYKRMTELAQASLETFQQDGDTWGIALSETELGIGAMREVRDAQNEAVARAKLGEAEHRLTLGLNGFRTIQDRWGIAIATGTLGNVAFIKAEFAHDTKKAEYARGIEFLRTTFKLFLEMNDGWGLATFMLSPARAACELQQWDYATTLMGAAQAFSDAIGAPVRLPFLQLFLDNKKRAEDALRETFADAWNKGQAMSPEQAIDYVFDGMRLVLEG